MVTGKRAANYGGRRRQEKVAEDPVGESTNAKNLHHKSSVIRELGNRLNRETKENRKKTVALRVLVVLHSFAVTHPFMTIAFAMLVGFYFTGVYLFVSALTHQSEWVADENGQLSHLPDTTVNHR